MNKTILAPIISLILLSVTSTSFGQEKFSSEQITSSGVEKTITSLEEERKSPTVPKVEKEEFDKKSNTKADSAEPDSIQPNENKIKRFEIGIHYTNLNFGVFDPTATKEFSRLLRNDQLGVPIINQDWNEVESGAGARFTYNLNRKFALETEVNWYPRIVGRRQAPLPSGVGLYQGGQKLQTLFGPKIGYRSKKFGIFGKARPGFIHFVQFPTVTFLLLGPPGFAILGRREVRKNFFNIDLGGVFEYYPSKKTVIRFDVGDTIIRYGRIKSSPDVTPSFQIPGYTRHNLQINVGFGFRF